MSKPIILVTGATGKTGLPTALGLLERGFPVRAFIHSRDARADRLRQAGAELTVGSLENYRDLAIAMTDVGRAYFCPPLEPGTLRRATFFAVAAREAKLEAVVYLSQWVSDAIHPAVHSREKWLTNQIFSSLAGLGAIAIQPGWFADNYFAVLGQAAQFGLLALPLGEGLNAPPSNEDIARVIVACLANPAPHVGKCYRPTGPKLLSPNDIAHAMGEALGRRVRYVDAPMPMFLKAATALKIPDFTISQLYWYLQDYQRNAFGIGAPTNVVEYVTGAQAEDFATIARRYVRASPHAARGLLSALREVGGLFSALAAGKPNVENISKRLGAPHLAGFALAQDSASWLAGHV